MCISGIGLSSPKPCHWLVGPPVPLLVIDGLRVGYSWDMENMESIDTEKLANWTKSQTSQNTAEMASNYSSSLALFLCRCMAFIGIILFVGGLIAGIILTVHSRQYGNGIFGYGTFFDRHEYAIVGIPLMSSALTFGLPFAAIGSYMSARLRSMNG
jgi:hypothetical protein